MNDWTRTREHLINTGAMTERGSTRGARARYCTGCNAVVLIGHDADHCALDVTVDPDPLGVVGEVVAQGQGRRTFALVKAGGRLELNYRDGGRITHTPAGSPRLDVLAEHRCGDTTLAAFAIASVLLDPDTVDLPSGSPAPF